MLGAAHGLPCATGLNAHAVLQDDAAFIPHVADLVAEQVIDVFIVGYFVLHHLEALAGHAVIRPDQQHVPGALEQRVERHKLFGQGRLGRPSEGFNGAPGGVAGIAADDMLMELGRRIGVPMLEDDLMRQHPVGRQGLYELRALSVVIHDGRASASGSHGGAARGSER